MTRCSCGHYAELHRDNGTCRGYHGQHRCDCPAYSTATTRKATR